MQLRDEGVATTRAGFAQLAGTPRPTDRPRQARAGRWLASSTPKTVPPARGLQARREYPQEGRLARRRRGDCAGEKTCWRLSTIPIARSGRGQDGQRHAKELLLHARTCRKGADRRSGKFGNRPRASHCSGRFGAEDVALADLRAPIDRFFEEVTVNAGRKQAHTGSTCCAFRAAVHKVADFSVSRDEILSRDRGPCGPRFRQLEVIMNETVFPSAARSHECTAEGQDRCRRQGREPCRDGRIGLPVPPGFTSRPNSARLFDEGANSRKACARSPPLAISKA